MNCVHRRGSVMGESGNIGIHVEYMYYVKKKSVR